MSLSSIDRESTQHPELMAGRLAELAVEPRAALAHYRREIRASGYYKAYPALGILLTQKGRLRESRLALL